MNDLALGLIALIVAAVPVSLGVLLLADGAGLDGEGRTRRRIRIALAVLAGWASPIGASASKLALVSSQNSPPRMKSRMARS